METVLEQIRDQQKASWNKFSPGWKKWDTLFMDFLGPMGSVIANRLQLKGHERVLDIASGTGEPAFTIAAKVPAGKVVMTDLAEGMLEVARENAARLGIANVQTRVCDVSELPFPDASFDAVSCRFGFMFFPDMAMAAKEMVRVLKPGGHLATAVWYKPEKNFWVTAMMDTIQKHIAVAPPPPGAPGMFRCAQDGLLAGFFSEAGLSGVKEEEVISTLNCRTAEVYWESMNEVAAPVVAALAQADEATREKIRKEVFALLHQKYPTNEVRINASALVISGVKA
jgi:SAM-dependent methyltransferase